MAMAYLIRVTPRQVVWSDSWDNVADKDAKTLGAIQTAPPVIHGKAIIGCDSSGTVEPDSA